MLVPTVLWKIALGVSIVHTKNLTHITQANESPVLELADLLFICNYVLGKLKANLSIKNSAH